MYKSYIYEKIYKKFNSLTMYEWKLPQIFDTHCVKNVHTIDS